MKSKKFYRHYLQRYFDALYSEYENDAAFYNDPAPNKWLFEIPDLSIKVLLTCDDDGIIAETRRQI